MENAMMIAAVAGPVYVILGLSILLYQKVWEDVVTEWSKDHYGLFGMMLAVLTLGLLIVNLYNEWEWNVWLLVTLTGWGMVLKGAFYFLAPGDTFKSVMKWAKKYRSMIYIDGMLLVLMGGALSYYVYLV